MRPLILASGSAIRRQLLASAGLQFSVEPADVDEAQIRGSLMDAHDDLDHSEVAGVLARAKAEAVSRLHPGALVIGADQILSLGKQVFEKPANLEGARAQLAVLAGQTHTLHSAVVLAEDGQTTWGGVQSAALTMRNFSNAFLDSYISQAGERICRSVGAYELEGMGLQLFERIEGDYFTILGLPMMPLLAELRSRGVLIT